MMKDKREEFAGSATAHCQRLKLLLLIIYLGALKHHVVRMPIQYLIPYTYIARAKSPDTIKSIHPSSAPQLSGRQICGPYLLPPNPPLNDLAHRLRV
jgi:hypothetical protein